VKKIKKLLIIAAANNFHFIKDISDTLNRSDNLDVKLFHMADQSSNKLSSMINDSDIIWFEWADGVCLSLLSDDFFIRKYLSKKKMILRLHRYELFNQNIIHKIDKIDHSVIDHLVFVSSYVKQIGVSHFPWMERGIVIPNLIDMDKFPFHDRMSGYELLFLGRISYVKNLPLMLDMFYELTKVDSNYRLNIVGNIHEKELIYYLDNYLNKTNLHQNINIHGYIENENLPEFMEGMNYICCSSIFESQGVGMLEGMATGLKPIVFNFPGAESFFPEQFLYIDRKGFVDAILRRGYSPKLYRQFVSSNYSIQKRIGLYEDLLK